MTIEQIRDMVSGKDYDFLRENEHLGDRIIFLTLGGSYSYGTNVETSDVDIRGCALNSKSDLLGLSNFEQVVNTQVEPQKPQERRQSSEQTCHALNSPISDVSRHSGKRRHRNIQRKRP